MSNQMCHFEINRFRELDPLFEPDIERAFKADDIGEFHRSLPGYKPTPLVSLSNLARQLGVAEVLVKDESHRFSLSAFKVLGASYATWHFLRQEWHRRFKRPLDLEELLSKAAAKELGDVTLCTATDGNHGRAVAWTAALFGIRAVIFMPENTVPARIDNIRSEGAVVEIVNGDYDTAVKRAAEEADRNGWHIISDTAYEGYIDIPRYIQAGYLTMFREIDDALSMFGGGDYDIVLVQSGVGSLAAAAAWYYRRERENESMRIVNVEPTEADCLLESARGTQGEIRSSQGSTDSIMAGLNCGTPSLVAWPVIRSCFDVFLSIPDRFSSAAIRAYYYPKGDDSRVISGESGAAGLAALLALCQEPSLARVREALELTAKNRVLLLNTEGATDPVNFDRLIAAAP
jgi:diaminopropionate ammonia-lyase